jgi:hypothetical protein
MVKALPPGRTVAGHYPGGRNTLNKEVSRMKINFRYIKVTFWILDASFQHCHYGGDSYGI